MKGFATARTTQSSATVLRLILIPRPDQYLFTNFSNLMLFLRDKSGAVPAVLMKRIKPILLGFIMRDRVRTMYWPMNLCRFRSTACGTRIVCSMQA